MCKNNVDKQIREWGEAGFGIELARMGWGCNLCRRNTSMSIFYSCIFLVRNHHTTPYDKCQKDILAKKIEIHRNFTRSPAINFPLTTNDTA